MIEPIVERVLVREGGVADVGDGKGITRYGQTEGWLLQHGLPIPKSRDEARRNYLLWAKQLGFDELARRSVEIADQVIDYSVLSGDETGVSNLQAALGAGLLRDGRLGPKTFAALDRALAAGREGELARDIFARRLDQLGELLSSKKVDRRKFAESWLNRMAGIARRLPLRKP